MADPRLDGIKINSFDVAGIERPGRVYAHDAHEGNGRWVVCFNEPWLEKTNEPHIRWSGLPSMNLYVPDFDAALVLALEIGAAHKTGNVDRYIGRWRRECADAEARARHE